ncbi:TPA: hypothetical protein DIS56_02385 [Candidatus Saccharibacteria bacterium]|nr:MAG: hypothetical protein UX30_C0005G0022 [Candidatus Saccharibacteria bacterium GW2011_GWA2_46_10]OGL34391.1 MAG: hypothetical protein A3F05_03340 [Candidatus Saccharibacteria bacterium RIFCSPHIGHO2_12_FULL_47_17]HCM51959.1 hypothetical protein [Candidatus Saccharibacteria bacterium]
MLRKLNRKFLVAGGLGLVVGILIILGIRFATYQPDKGIHYHANFAVFLNGQREEFKDIFYYIGGESCTGETEHQMTPYARAHMHDRVNDVVHIEDEAVTWGQFFQNMAWVVDPKIIRTPDRVWLADSANKVSFMLNGEKVDNIVGRVIGNKDRLLVDFGSTNKEVLQKEFETVASTAEQYNGSQDPGSCGGEAEKNTWKDRLKHML